MELVSKSLQPFAAVKDHIMIFHCTAGRAA